MTDTERSLFCPACGEEMHKFYIESAKCYVDICLKGCGGIYFDKGELQKMDETHEKIPELVEIYKNNDFMLVDTDKARMCPVCNHIMIKKYSSLNDEVEIDECHTCGGVFLDCNELFQIRNEHINSPETGNSIINSIIEQFNINYDKVRNESSDKNEPNDKQLIDKIINSINNI